MASNVLDIPKSAEELDVSASDYTNTKAPFALYVGTGGDIVVRPAIGSADVTFSNYPSGLFLPIQCVAVRTSGTTASDLVAVR